MIQSGSTLTAQQTALQQLALRQAEAFQSTLKRLQTLPAVQADREAVADSLDWLGKADDTLRNWFGGSPETDFDD
jgi:C4-dicarboxylate-specific signal transduction histidine kinase